MGDGQHRGRQEGKRAGGGNIIYVGFDSAPQGQFLAPQQGQPIFPPGSLAGPSHRNQFSRPTCAAVGPGRGSMGSTSHPKGPGWRSSAAAPDAWADSRLHCGVTVTCAGDGFLHVTANPAALEGTGHVQGGDGLPIPHLSPLRARREGTRWG